MGRVADDLDPPRLQAGFFLCFPQGGGGRTRVMGFQATAGKTHLPGVMLEFVRAARQQYGEAIPVVDQRDQHCRGDEPSKPHSLQHARQIAEDTRYMDVFGRAGGSAGEAFSNQLTHVFGFAAGCPRYSWMPPRVSASGSRSRARSSSDRSVICAAISRIGRPSA